MSQHVHRSAKLGVGVIFSTSILALCAAQPALAQGNDKTTSTDAPIEFGDIIVTAQKRSESLQKVPLAISAFSGDTLAQRNVGDLPQIATIVPSVNIQQRLGFGVVTIRGIGFDQLTAGADASVAVHQDGVYQARPTTALSGFFDVERVEIARGPQGTLYGRNATGGAVNIISRKPTEDASGYLDFSYGNYNALTAEGALSGPILDDKVLARLAVKLDTRDGFGTNLTSGRDVDDLNTRAARLTVELRPSEALTLTIAGDVYRQRDAANAIHLAGFYNPCAAFPVPAGTRFGCGISFGGKPAPNIRDSAASVEPYNSRTVYGVSGTLNYELSDSITLRNVVGYRKTRTTLYADNDGTDFYVFNVGRYENSKAFSNELQFIGDMGGLKWILGGYYFHDKDFAKGFGDFGPATLLDYLFQQGQLTTKAAAVFGQATFEVTDWLSLTAGGRYSDEKKSLFDERLRSGSPRVSPFAGLTRQVKFNSFTPKFGIELKPSNELLIFGNAQKGFKSGGFAVGAEAPPFLPETIWSYEAGLKWTSQGNRLNLTGFHYDYKDVQVGRVFAVGTTIFTQIQNAAAASITGVELEGDVGIVGNLRADLTASYIDGHYTNYTTFDPNRTALGAQNLNGNSLPQLSKFSFNLGIQNSWNVGSGKVTLRGEAFHASRYYFTPFNVASTSQPSYELYNAFLSYTNDRWSGSLFMRNVANKTVVAGGFLSSTLAGSPINVSLLPPRTFGAKVGYKF